MVEISATQDPNTTEAPKLRPVNLSTDLGPLADLIETAFAGSMDAGGRAAIREMRQLSRLGPGLGVISHLNELAQGMSLGYVWVVDGQLVGNVSIYPADWPRDMGRAWIIANVAVYPDYRGQGIATRLMQASLETIRHRGGGTAILQVDADNETARHMYRNLGFVDERVFTQWRRSPYRALPPMPPDGDYRIVHRAVGDWRAEYALALMTRPQERGGVDWLRPTHPHIFRRGPINRLREWLTFRSSERLIIRAPERKRLLASLWIESNLGVETRSLTLMNDPEHTDCVDPLIALAVRRFGGRGLSISHPADEAVINDLLHRYQFRERRTVMHMRLDID